MSQDATALARRLAQCSHDPTRELLLLAQPLLPSARLLGTLRWLIDRDHLSLEVLTEEDAFHLVYSAVAVPLLAGRLVHIPYGLFPDGSELREQFRLVGARFNYLPSLPLRSAHHDGTVGPAWETLLAPLAFSAWLAAGTPIPWTAEPTSQAESPLSPYDQRRQRSSAARSPALRVEIA